MWLSLLLRMLLSRVSSVRWFVTWILPLVAFSSVTVGNTLYFPFVQRDASHETGIAVSNTTHEPGEIALTLYDVSGKIVAQTTHAVNPDGQLDGTITDLLGVSGEVTGWLRLEGSIEVAALGILLRTDNGWVASLPVVRAPDMIQFFPHVAVGSGWRTTVAIANTSTSRANAKAVLYDASGNLLAVQPFTLPASGHALLDIGSLFKVADLSSGHLEIAADQPTVTSELFESSLGIGTLGGQAPVTAGNDGKWTQFFPFVTNDSSRWTGVAYVNESAAPSLVKVELFGSNGSLIASRVDLLGGKAQKVYLLSDLAQTWQGAGFLRITGDTPLVGFVLTGSNEISTNSMTAWGNQIEIGKELRVPHIAEVPGWASDFSLVNLGPVDAQVEINAFDQAGNFLTKGVTTVGANQQLHQALASLLSVSGLSGGSLKITSNTNIIAANLFTAPGGYAGVGAMLPADLPERTIPGVLLADETVGPEGGEIAIKSLDPGNPLARIHLSVPAGALDSKTEIQILATVPTVPNADPHFLLRQYPIQLLPSGLKLKVPARLTIPASPDMLTSSQPLQSLEVLTYDNSTKTWQALSVVGSNTAASTVDVLIPHFSLYDLDSLNQSIDVTDNLATVLGNSNDIYSGIKLILNKGAANEEVGAFMDGVNAAATGLKIGNDLGNGRYLEATQEAIEFASEQTLGAACDLALDGTANTFCNLMASGVFALSDIAGEYLGDKIADLQATHDGRTLELQIQRYLALRQAGHAQGQVPTCPGGWYPDPQNGCGFADGKFCVFGTCNYPDALSYYNPQYVANAAEQIILRATQISENAVKFQQALIRIAQQLISKYGSQSTLSAAFTISPSLQGPSPFSINVQTSASPTGLTYVWDFGDGTRLSAGSSSNHIYRTPGLYTISLTVQDTQSMKTAQSSQSVGVIQPSQPAPGQQTGPPKISTTTTSVNLPGTVTLSATGFNPGAAVQFYWSSQNSSLSSSGNRRAGTDGTVGYTISFPANAAVGQYTAYAQESGGQTSNIVSISVTGTQPVPNADSVTPTQATLDATGLPTSFQVTITGANFVSGASVRVYYARNNNYGGQLHNAGDLVGLVPNVVLQGGTQLSVPLTLGQGDFNLVVVNPDQQQSQPVLFVVSVPSIQPAISQIQPSQVPAGQPTTLTVTGTGFQYGFTASVSTSQGPFNITLAGLSFVSPTQVQVQVTMGPSPNPPLPGHIDDQ